MATLAQLPELVGFFSYSREDDEDSGGALSALRDRIQRELRGQLGRSKSTFRLWQDKEAIAPGKLWETEIKTAAAQAVFFIPIITPTVVRSRYCKFELESFLDREAELGRSDLVFPILYINVPELEDPGEREKDPVLTIIAKRQYLDWREFRHREVQSMDVKEAVERFCAHICIALRRPWLSPEEKRKQGEEAARLTAEAERKRQQEEAERREAAARKAAAEAEAAVRAWAEKEEEARIRAQKEAEARALAQKEAEARVRSEQAQRAEAEAKRLAKEALSARPAFAPAPPSSATNKAPARSSLMPALPPFAAMASCIILLPFAYFLLVLKFSLPMHDFRAVEFALPPALGLICRDPGARGLLWQFAASLIAGIASTAGMDLAYSVYFDEELFRIVGWWDGAFGTGIAFGLFAGTLMRRSIDAPHSPVVGHSRILARITHYFAARIDGRDEPRLEGVRRVHRVLYALMALVSAIFSIGLTMIGVYY